MKFFLQILAVIAIVLLLFFLLGYVVSTQANVSKVEVNAPIEFCWDIFHDEKKVTQWMDGIESLIYISGSKNQVGAKQKLNLKSNTQTSGLSEFSEVVRTVQQVDQPTYFSYDYSNDMLSGSTEVRFEMRGDSATVITNVDSFRASQLWMRSVLFLMKGSIQEKSQVQFDQLKNLIENEYNYNSNQPKETLATPEVSNESDTVN